MSMKPAFFEMDSYTPNHLLDSLMEKLKVRSDAALARALNLAPSTISKVRNKRMAVNSALLLNAHELTEISVRDLRTLMGDVHTKYWLGDSRTDDGDALAKRRPRHVAKPHHSGAVVAMYR